MSMPSRPTCGRASFCLRTPMARSVAFSTRMVLTTLKTGSTGWRRPLNSSPRPVMIGTCGCYSGGAGGRTCRPRNGVGRCHPGVGGDGCAIGSDTSNARSTSDLSWVPFRGSDCSLFRGDERADRHRPTPAPIRLNCATRGRIGGSAATAGSRAPRSRCLGGAGRAACRLATLAVRPFPWRMVGATRVCGRRGGRGALSAPDRRPIPSVAIREGTAKCPRP